MKSFATYTTLILSTVVLSSQAAVKGTILAKQVQEDSAMPTSSASESKMSTSSSILSPTAAPGSRPDVDPAIAESFLNSKSRSVVRHSADPKTRTAVPTDDDESSSNKTKSTSKSSAPSSKLPSTSWVYISLATSVSSILFTVFTAGI